MASNQRTPPRFVPTLTTVLDMPAGPLPLMSEEEAQHAPSAEQRQAALAAAMAGMAADRETDQAVDRAAGMTAKRAETAESAMGANAVSAEPTAPAVPTASASAATPTLPESQIAIDVHALSDADAFSLEEQLMHRVLQRIDLSLEERLSDTVSAAVQQQLDAMVPRLRSEIEGVLRSLVVEALSKELSDNTGSVPASGPQSVG